MHITIQLPPDLEHDLIRQAAATNTPLQTVILQALRQTMQTSPKVAAQWSEPVLTYEGIADFPAFESYRGELLAPSDPELL